MICCEGGESEDKMVGKKTNRERERAVHDCYYSEVRFGIIIGGSTETSPLCPMLNIGNTYIFSIIKIKKK